MAAQAPPELLGMHTNMPGVIPPDVAQALPIPGQLAPGGPPPPGLSADEERAFKQISTFYTRGAGYAVEMATQPQTMYGVADSPVGLAAWMINHDAFSYGEIADAFAGHPAGELTRDEVLDNITLYWLTNTGVSSGRLYWDNKFGFFDAKNVSIPAAVSVFPGELYQSPRSWAERAYPNLIYYNEVDRGGHFAAWEQPQLLSAEVRAAFQSLR
jgi:pimeloyl-ACP methyl ester carboxylesterase